MIHHAQWTIRGLSLVFLGLIYLSEGAVTCQGAGGNFWRTDFDAAYKEAVREQRPLLIHFYGETCPPCRRMEQEVFSQPDVVNLLSSQFIAVKVDAGNPANVQAGPIVQRFGVHALPTDIIVDPLSGRLLSQVEGYQDLARYRSTALRSRSMFDQSHKVIIVEQRQETPPPGSESTLEPAQDISLGNPQPIVGLDGFSPVTLGASRKWVPGDPRYAFEYKGVTYYMTSSAELEAFRSRPEAFAPRLLGCDPVVLYETDRAVQGRTDFGAYFDGDLYLFDSDESRRRFKVNPPKYTRIQHVLKVDHLPRVARQPAAESAIQ